MIGSLYSLEWTTGMDYWTGILNWSTGLAIYSFTAWSNSTSYAMAYSYHGSL